MPKNINKIKWCCKQSKGISFIDPNDNLSEEYIKEADSSLESMLSTKGKWKTIIAYYSCYNAIYSILMKTGIKCEIHDCSISLMAYFDEFTEEDIEFINSLKKDRIDNQYYLKNIEFEENDKVKAFILKCKNILKNNNLVSISKSVKDDIKTTKK